MRALITGGAGFIGHHLARALLQSGYEVTIIDDLSSGTKRRIDSFDGQIRFVEGSILNARLLDAATSDCDVIFHLAAIASVARSIDAPVETDAVNVRGTIEVLLAGSRNGVRRVIFAGSSAVYGATTTLPSRETDLPAPVSPYGVSKLAAEHYLHALGHLHGIDTVVLRYFNVFGAGQDPKSDYAAVVPAFIAASLEGRRPTVNGSGEISRDFIHIDNVVAANLLAAGLAAPSQLTCNIASGSRTTLLELLGSISRALDVSVDPIFGPPRPGDVLDSEADISIAERWLGYRVVVPFDEGIRRTVASYQEAGSN